MGKINPRDDFQDYFDTGGSTDNIRTWYEYLNEGYKWLLDKLIDITDIVEGLLDNEDCVIKEGEPVSPSVVDGSAVYWNGTAWDLATTSNLPQGVALNVAGGYADIYLYGEAEGFSGLTAGAEYRLHNTNAGEIVLSTDANASNIRIGYGKSSTIMLIDVFSYDNTDETVKVSNNDTIANYLGNKIVAGTGIQITELNDGSDEDLQISYTGELTDEKIKVSNNDTTADYLKNKIVAGDGSIQITELNDGSDEDLQIMIPDGGITTPKIADSAITTEKVADSNITTPKIADGAITTPKIVDGAITTAKILDGNITTVKLEGGSSSPGNSKYYGTDSSGNKGFFDLPSGGYTQIVQQDSFADAYVTTTSSTWVQVSNVEITMTTTGNPVLLFFNATFAISSDADGNETEYEVRITMDGNSLTHVGGKNMNTYSIEYPLTIIALANPSAGSHTFKVEWYRRVGNGTAYIYLNDNAGQSRFIAYEL